MTIKDDIEKQYLEILTLSEKYDNCYKKEDSAGWTKYVLIKNKERACPRNNSKSFR